MDDTPITPLQSGTIRAAIGAIVVNVLALVTVATGQLFDVSAIQDAVNDGVTLAVNLFSIYYGVKAFRGRMNATAPIQIKPKSEETKP